ASALTIQLHLATRVHESALFLSRPPCPFLVQVSQLLLRAVGVARRGRKTGHRRSSSGRLGVDSRRGFGLLRAFFWLSGGAFKSDVHGPFVRTNSDCMMCLAPFLARHDAEVSA